MRLAAVKLARREDRTFTLDLLARTVGRLAASKPLVLLFEDLHLADASIEAIQYVFHRRSSSRLMIASTYVQAGGGDGDPLSRLVKSLRGDQGTLLIQLKALEADDCRELAAGILGKDRVPEDSGPPLLQATGGNPFFVAELVRNNELAAKPEQVKAHVEELAASYEKPCPDSAT